MTARLGPRPGCGYTHFIETSRRAFRTYADRPENGLIRLLPHPVSVRAAQGFRGSLPSRRSSSPMTRSLLAFGVCAGPGEIGLGALHLD